MVQRSPIKLTREIVQNDVFPVIPLLCRSQCVDLADDIIRNCEEPRIALLQDGRVMAVTASMKDKRPAFVTQPKVADNLREACEEFGMLRESLGNPKYVVRFS
jgi:hypothetical protein